MVVIATRHSDSDRTAIVLPPPRFGVLVTAFRCSVFSGGAVPSAECISRSPEVLETMDDPIPRVATVLAALLAVGAFVTLFMQRPIVAGTLFVFTAFTIYIRETNK